MALFCVMLAGAIGTAQAVHIHGDWLPKKGTHASVPVVGTQAQGEEHCPLCAAMHSAMPAMLQAVPAPVLETALRLAGDVLVSQQTLETFAMFSRPPPAADTMSAVAA